MMISPLWAWQTQRRFRDYRPQQVTMRTIRAWLSQFHKADHKTLKFLLHKVRYYSEAATQEALVRLNSELLERLLRDGITIEKVIYVQIADAGSSSGVMLNLLRDAARLEGRGCLLLDWRDMDGLREATARLQEGAVVYVDDFSGSGKQFCGVRDFVAEFLPRNFAEFYLLPCICSEARKLLDDRGVVPLADHIHTTAERPLHAECTMLRKETKARMLRLCEEISGDRHGLGFHRLATMVAFYRNSPNNMPLLLRGNPSQNRYVGVLPRTTDLPRL